MEKPVIYTYGNNSIDAKDLVRILQPYHINCVVDCRPQAYTMELSNTPSDELQQVLKQNNIAYLPFSQHFGVFPKETRNKNGTILYSKVIKSQRFLEGIQRLETGVEKGYTICIIDHERETAPSRRYIFIGMPAPKKREAASRSPPICKHLLTDKNFGAVGLFH